MMIGYLDALEELRRGCKAPVACDNSFSSIPVNPEMLAAWQVNFDKMLEIVKDDPTRSRNVRMERLGLDIWTVMHTANVRKTRPDFKFEPAAVLARAKNAAEEMKNGRQNRAKRRATGTRCPGPVRGVENGQHPRAAGQDSGGAGHAATPERRACQRP